MKTCLVVDAGNTRIKIGLYLDDNLNEVRHFSSDQKTELSLFLSGINYDHAILSSVLNSEETQAISSLLKSVLLFSEATIPLKNAYETPGTLGADRLANAVAIAHRIDGNRLCIDIGTCIKFDFVDENNTYQGGSISPGIQLRYRALNEFTGKLPLVSKHDKTDFTGKSTETCLQSGVINGMQEEIHGFVKHYEEKYEGLTIFVTGGDHINFDYSSKNDIFADENLTLFGLLKILKANVQ